MVRLRERETEINKIKPSIIPQGHYHPKITKISTEEGKITAFLLAAANYVFLPSTTSNT